MHGWQSIGVRIFTSVALLCAGASLHAQHAPDIIRGKVTDERGKPLVSVKVTVDDSAGTSRSTLTNADGRYSLFFQGGSGKYRVSATAIAHLPAVVLIRRVADEAVLVANLTLKAASAGALEEVVVKGQKRQKVYGYSTRGGTPGETSSRLWDGRVSPDAASDIARVAASVPGVRLTPDGYSVMGASADQNNVTLNGMNFSGEMLPPGAAVTLTTATYDVARGGFGGGQLSAYMYPGSNTVMRILTVSLDAPPLQFSDPSARQLGQRFTNLSLGWNGSGPLIEDKLFYTSGLRIARRGTALAALDLIDPAAAQRAGVAADSVARLASVLAAHGIPLRPLHPPGDQGTVSGSALVRFDFQPNMSPTGANVLLSAAFSRGDATGAYPTAFLSRAGRTGSTSLSAQAEHTRYFKDAFLNDASLAVSYNQSSSTPYFQLPSASVLVTSQFTDGTQAVSTLQFGGNGSAPSLARSWNVEGRNELAWLSIDNKHQFKMSADAQFASVANRQFPNRNGAYTYTSLADLDANRPATFTRTFAGLNTSAGLWSGALSLGDSWRPWESGDIFQLQYGLRLEGNRYTVAPAYNPALDSLLHVRTDHAPNTLALIPRVGMTWTVPGLPPIKTSGFPKPRLVIQAGTGLFRSAFSPSLLAGPLATTGLPDGRRQLTCLGSVIPTPDWAAFGADPDAVPDICLNGTTPTPLANASPAVQLLSSHYRPARSWRSTVTFATYLGDYTVNIGAAYSRGTAQSDSRDLNFTGTPLFSLPDEGGRPVFVSPSSIVASTGAVSTNESRRTDAFSRVASTESDAMTSSRQFTLSFVKIPNFQKAARFIVAPSLYYTLSRDRMRRRGFGSTAGNPLDMAWSRSDYDVRHQLQARLTMYPSGGLLWYLSLSGTLTSGSPYTPLVSGDINGDGYANDRAFVFDPATSVDPAVQGGMTSLLNNLDARAKRCLTRQLGHIAARNSCTGPWQQSLDLRTTLRGSAVHLSDRVTFNGYLSNLLGAADQLLHGWEHLRGWGTAAYPNAVLLTPRGFDASANRFTYDVNPRFGDTKFSRALTGTQFRFTIGASIMVGPSGDTQEQWSYERRLRGWLRTAEHPNPITFHHLVYPIYDNVFRNLVALRDSINLSADQLKAVQAEQRDFDQRVDSLTASINRELATLTKAPTDGQLSARIFAARAAERQLYLDVYQARLVAILTPVQVAAIPIQIRMFLTQKNINYNFGYD